MTESVSPHPDDQLAGKLSYVLALARTGRQRTHRVVLCSIADLEQRLEEVGAARRRKASGIPERAVHCVLAGHDPLDYNFPTPMDGSATCADVARLWLRYLEQRLAITTTGSHNRPYARSALAAFRECPALIRELNLRVEVGAGAQPLVEKVAEDLQLVRPLWDLPALDVRGAPMTRQRLQVQVVHGVQSRATAWNVINNVLRKVGMSDQQLTNLLSDSTRLVFREEHPDRPATLTPGHGIGVQAELFTVPPDGKTIHPVHTRPGQPRLWRAAAVPALRQVRKAGIDE